MFTKKNLLRISLFLNISVAFYFVTKHLYYSKKWKPNELEVAHNLQKIKYFDSLPISNTDVVLLGNSLTASFPVELLNSANIKNRGIHGNTCKDLIGRLNPIVAAKPKKIILEIGINDLLNGATPEDLFIDYKVLIEKIKEKSPITRLYVTSLFPVTLNSDKKNSSVLKINKLLYDYCEISKVDFIDIYQAFSKNNSLDLIYTNDGIHLNLLGYKKWANKLIQIL